MSDFELDPSYALPRHAHARPSIAITLAGTLEIHHGSGRVLRLERGAGAVIPGGEPHLERVPGGAARCVLVSYEAGWAEGDACLPHGWDRLDSVAVGELSRLVSDAVEQGDDLGLDAVVHELTTAAGVEAARTAANESRPGRPGWLPRVREMLDDRHRDPPSLSDLAVEAGVTREHLARVFRRQTGLTVGQYVRRRRVLEGASRLRGSALPLPDIAFALGYADQSHFTRQFRRQIGVTPGQYRRIHAS